MVRWFNDLAGLKRMLPRTGPAVAGIVLVAAVAFLLGALVFDGGDLGPSGQPDQPRGSTAEGKTTKIWTCSMHPQIRLPGPGKCPICFMDLIPLETEGEDGLSPRQIHLSESAREMARIATTPVRRAFAERQIRMVGRITYDESNVSSITAWVPGRLDRLYADFTGIAVKEGDHMVSMYSPELLAAQEELLQASAAVDSLAVSGSTTLRSTALATKIAAREKLRLYGLSIQQIDAIVSSGTPSEELTINAPIGGVVIKKEALEGMYVQTGTRIYTIADLSKLWVV
ncbi:MAG: efflux RND transporter periplasmic adaptor subunit, partial [Proteobacteria bacterium]|nr:efflux RND transporter periplasmic adaptor subunit [Pseudomonadota bacterium]